MNKGKSVSGRRWSYKYRQHLGFLHKTPEFELYLECYTVIEELYTEKSQYQIAIL